MLYSEFIAGTSCKDTAHNYQVYKNLEVMYMNSSMTKTEIYEYGRKLVDNSKTEEELKFEAERKAEIEQLKLEIKYHKTEKEMYLNWSKDGMPEYKAHYKQMAKYHNSQIKERKNKIQLIKQWFLS